MNERRNTRVRESEDPFVVEKEGQELETNSKNFFMQLLSKEVIF